MKKLLAILLTVIVFMTSAGVVCFAKTEQTAANLSRLSTITSIGLPASDLHTKSGNYTMKLSGEDIYKNIKIPCIRDWSEYNTMQMWVYSPNDLKASVSIALISDSENTAALDYYVATFDVGQTGWNLISLPYENEYSEFKTVNSPKGMDDIDRIEIWTQYGGEVPDSALTLYFDDIILKTLDLTKLNASKDDKPVAGKPEKEGVDAFGPFTLGAGNGSAGTPYVTDWTPYNTLVMEMDSVNASMRDWWFVLRSENPDTTTADYYHTDLTANWQGEKTIVFDIRGGFSKSGNPLGMDKITGLDFWSTNVIENENTLITVKRIYLTNRDWSQIFNPENGNYLIEAVMEDGFTDYVSIMKQRHSGDNAHPSMFFDKERLEKMREWTKTDEYMRKSYARLIDTCEALLKGGPLTVPSPINSRNLISGALAYLLSGDQRYKDWVWDSMYALTVKQNMWNEGHESYLTVGDMMRAVSYVYDWMYNDWDEEQRMIVRNAIVHYGAEPTLHYTRAYNKFAGETGGNWGQVIMSGLCATGLALAGEGEEYKDLSNEIINRAVTALTNMHPKTISPDGDYVEGVGYWGYGMMNYLPFLGAMWTSLGTTAGLADLPGMRRCGNLPIGSTGPQGYYNFADTAGGGVITVGGYFFLSEYFDDPTYGAFQINYTSKSGGEWDSIILYEPKEEYKDYLKYMPKYTYSPGNNETVTIRRSWVDDNAAFLGVKAGANTSWHDHLDVGSYIYDFLGVRWAIELGADDYNHLNFYEDGKYAFYRNRAEGQNALVINPDGKVDQNTGAQYHCPIGQIEVNDNAAYVTMDVTKAYEGRGASSVKRGFAMLNNYGALLIRDEIESSRPIEVYSFMHTKAQIEVAPDGKSAVLTQEGQKLSVKLIGNSSGRLVDMAADPLPTSPNPKEAYPRSGIRKLAVHVENEKSPVINMILTPYVEHTEYEFSLDSVLPMRSWKTYLKDAVQVDNIYIDNVPIQSFDKDVSSYVVNECEVGTVSCDAPGLDLEIKQAEKLGDTAFIVVRSKQSKAKAVYTVNFSNGIQKLMEVSSCVPKRIYSDVSSNTAERIMDSDITTGWAVGEPASIDLDFGEPKLFKEIKALWFKGSERIIYFSISVSDDGENWKQVFDGESRLTDDFETYTFEPVTARYLRIHGKRNSASAWVTLNELRVTSYEDSYNDISSHWAKTDIQHLANIGVLSSSADGKFHPDAAITRGEFIDLVSRAARYGKMAHSGKLADVTENLWYTESIEGALDAGIIPDEMIADGCFMPDQPITCEEMLAIATLACNYKTGDKPYYASLDSFHNKDLISLVYLKYLQNAVALKLMGGNLSENGGIDPQANATRAQAAVIAKRVYIKTY